MFKDYCIKELFDVKNNPQLDKGNFVFSETAEYPYFTRTEANNGILGYVEYLDEEHKIQGNSLAVGMISMKFHYMKHDFYAGQFTKTLIPKFQEFDERIALYFIAVLNKHSAHYQSYLVRHFKDKVSETVISLPVIDTGEPDHKYSVNDIDWRSLKKYIAEIEQGNIAELDAYLIASGLDDYKLSDEDREALSLSPRPVSDEEGAAEADFGAGEVKFKKFALGALFASSTGDVDLQKKDINGKGEYFINSGVENRGIKGRTDKPARTFPANTITIDFWGNAYYRDFEYKLATHNHVFSLTGDVIRNKFVGMYIVGALSSLPKLFSYNNMATWNKLKAIEVTLPVTSNGDIDYDYMERYIRAIEKLAIAGVVKYRDRLTATIKQVVSA